MNGAPARILVVEDEALVAAMLKDMLEALGAQVVGPAHSLAIACEMAESAACEAALLDVNLMGENVAPVARILAERGIPFVFATGYAGGISDVWPDAPVIEKPYSMADIERALLAVGVRVAVPE
jgi:CheY-like chemotaxis protein